MIKYAVRPEIVIARFATDGEGNRQYWVSNITTNICRRLESDAFHGVIYKIAQKFVNERSCFVGVMNNPPNVEVGKAIAKQRLLKKYNSLEDRVHKEFLRQLKQLPCIKLLIRSQQRAIKDLQKIRRDIQLHNLYQDIIGVNEELFIEVNNNET